jgi:hypothetical protein
VRQPLHHFGNQGVGLFNCAAWLVDKAGLDVAPAASEVVGLVADKQRFPLVWAWAIHTLPLDPPGLMKFFDPVMTLMMRGHFQDLVEGIKRGVGSISLNK